MTKHCFNCAYLLDCDCDTNGVGYCNDFKKAHITKADIANLEGVSIRTVFRKAKLYNKKLKRMNVRVCEELNGHTKLYLVLPKK